MVGLVVVSHSATLARGVAELVRSLPGPPVALAVAGGLDLPERPLGTDAYLVQRAVAEVYSEDGVLVLMDLGSAILSAEMALEAFPAERRARVVLCEAPLVEGAVAAAVQAQLGGSLEQVAASARAALEPKALQLGPAAPPPFRREPAETPVGTEARRELRLIVGNRLGLHLRPAARIVQTAGRFRAEIRVANATASRGPVSAQSINGLMTLAVRQGHEISVTATGPEAEAGLAALQALAEANFGDEEQEPTVTAAEQRPTSEPPDSSFLQGLPASPGIATGLARPFRVLTPRIPAHPAANPRAEWEALRAAIEKTRLQIQATRDGVARRAGASAAAILEAHLSYLADDALRDPARRGIFEEGLNAAAAWQRTIEGTAASYATLDDAYLRARAEDVTEVGRQVILNLLGEAPCMPILTEPGILIAPDLTVAQAARLDPTLTLGICTAFGGPTSHSAILARSLGIPAVVGVGERILDLAAGSLVIVDGDAGRVWCHPDPALAVTYTRESETARLAQTEARATSAARAVTRDGREVEVVANISSPADARRAVEAGAEGVGLFRTEFLFLDRRAAPAEDEQFEAYRSAAAALGGRPLTIRTLDVGGDKPLAFLDREAEANPFLGRRAIRLCLERPDLFGTQLRAIVRVAAEFPVMVMFPMIATLSEWRRGRALLQEACGEIARRAGKVPGRIEVGIMVEVPAAALRAARFAEEVDFFSVGTNDLAQYTLAAERGNPRVAELADAFQPAVLQLIQRVVEAAHARGKRVGVCGELASDPLAVPLLVGLGVDALSMNPPAIPRAKQIIRSLDSASARAQALAAVELDTPEAVREQLRQLR
jgi:phosphoenolpyruvate-protein phosphotransferase/dihydroxyacetone kinase phosphotransfer subunit